ncbi:hypothetical protein SDC9_187678 [bioreactor metagenome]|uniref:Uncharacterized protein n=1 Tax=bioreactor metagenome TaxID=1076179 RepID=A0A645HNV9_9ZZZZ
MGGEDHAGGGAVLRQLLYSQYIAKGIAALAAELPRKGDAHHAALRHFDNSLAGKAVVFIHFPRDRRRLPQRELGKHPLGRFMLPAQ